MIVPEKASPWERAQGFAVFALIFAASYLMIRFSAGTGTGTHFSFSYTGIVLTSSQGESVSVDYTEMEEILLLENPDYGTPVSGGTENGVREGIWKSDTLGEYTASAEERIAAAVFLRTEDRAYLFNCEAQETTAVIYETIAARMAGGKEE